MIVYLSPFVAVIQPITTIPLSRVARLCAHRDFVFAQGDRKAFRVIQCPAIGRPWSREIGFAANLKAPSTPSSGFLAIGEFVLLRFYSDSCCHLVLPFPFRLRVETPAAVGRPVLTRGVAPPALGFFRGPVLRNIPLNSRVPLLQFSKSPTAPPVTD